MEKQLEAIAAQLERNNQLFERWIDECKSANAFHREHQNRVAQIDGEKLPVEIATLKAQAEYFNSHAALNRKWGEPPEPNERS